MSANAPRDYRRAPEPIPVPERDTIIPSFYNAADHDDLDATVTQNGMPVAENGELLTVGMVPPERRFAVGRAEDGAAELYAQDVFEQSYRLYLEEDLRVKGGRPAFPALWPIPTVRNFVGWKVMPHDTSRLVPLGIPFHRENPRPSATKYDPRLDRIIDALDARVVAPAAAPVVAEAAVAQAEAPKKRGRKPMSPEARAAAAERLARGRETAKANREAAEAPPAA